MRSILEQDKQCRNSDYFLYLKVIARISEENHFFVPLQNMTVENFLRRLPELPVPGFETVRRTRQKVQEERPDLAACEAVAGFRAENEREFREFARGEA